MPKLKVEIGPDRHNMEVAWVNVSDKPTLIDTDKFAGRILVHIRDFVGVTPDGSPPTKESPYFEGRTRRFGIHIEGRFKAREGEQPYTGDDIWFGSDFDYLPKEFPRRKFDLGLRIARWVDPNLFYEMHPPSGRPYTMSPFVGCMQLICAWPAPNRAHEAVVVLAHRHDDGSHSPPDQHDIEAADLHEAGLVPSEQLDPVPSSPKVHRHTQQYWFFRGFKGDPGVDKFLQTHAPALLEASVPTSPTLRPTLQHQPSGIGTVRRAPADIIEPLALDEEPESEPEAASDPTQHVDRPKGKLFPVGLFGRKRKDEKQKSVKDKLKNVTISDKDAPRDDNADSLATSTKETPSESSKDTPAADLVKETATASPAPTSGTESSNDAQPPLRHTAVGNVTFASRLLHPSASSHNSSSSSTSKYPDDLRSRVEAQLGPWKFADPTTDLLEDNAFMFDGETRSVAKRRKHFYERGGQNRKGFVFDPDVVYAASFFSPFFDFNQFHLNMGFGLSMNIASYFETMPIRYTLRSARSEDDVFMTISFKLVDD